MPRRDYTPGGSLPAPDMAEAEADLNGRMCERFGPSISPFGGRS